MEYGITHHRVSVSNNTLILCLLCNRVVSVNRECLCLVTNAHCALLCAKESLIISFSLPPTVFFPGVDVIFHLAARRESVDKFCRGLLILICSSGRPHPFISYLFFFFLSLPLVSLSSLCLYLFLSHALPWSQTHNSQLPGRDIC